MPDLIIMLKENRFGASGVIGLIFLVLGVSFFLNTIFTIQEREQNLYNTTLSPEETRYYEGAHQ